MDVSYLVFHQQGSLWEHLLDCENRQFERQRLEYENKKKRDLEEIKEEMAEKEANWEQNAKKWKGEMKKMTDQLKVLLINKYKWISIYI